MNGLQKERDQNKQKKELGGKQETMQRAEENFKETIFNSSEKSEERMG